MYETGKQNALYALENDVNETLAKNIAENSTDCRLVEYIEKICRFDRRFNIVLRLACRFAAHANAYWDDCPEREELEKTASEYRERVRVYLQHLYGLQYRDIYAVTDSVIEWAAFA